MSAIVSRSPLQESARTKRRPRFSFSDSLVKEQKHHATDRKTPGQNRTHPSNRAGDAKASRQPRWPPADEQGYTDRFRPRQHPRYEKTHGRRFGSLLDGGVPEPAHQSRGRDGIKNGGIKSRRPCPDTGGPARLERAPARSRMSPTAKLCYPQARMMRGMVGQWRQAPGLGPARAGSIRRASPCGRGSIRSSSPRSRPISERPPGSGASGAARTRASGPAASPGQDPLLAAPAEALLPSRGLTARELINMARAARAAGSLPTR